jgi:phosphatidylserine/phosphatidylglycerophosphate/cardiolipin synthase-like enzyme
MGPVRTNNEVMYLIDGPETFAQMARAMRTASAPGHFIYLLAWWLSDDFPLIPGFNPSTAHALFTAAAAAGAQVRVMISTHAVGLWYALHRGVVRRINELPHGGAIHDSRYLGTVGSNHQKVLVVNGTQGLIGFCGGIDIKANRVEDTGDGTPQHDAHCRVTGPGAHDLLRVFTERWNDHKDHVAIDRAKGPLVAAGVPSAGRGRQWVQTGRTYGNGEAHAGIDEEIDHKTARLGTWGQGPPGVPPPMPVITRGYKFAPRGEQTAWRMIRHAIRQAQRFIYLEDQYLVSMEASRELEAVLPRIAHLTILIPHGSQISELPQTNYRRQQFIAPLRKVGKDKVRVFYLTPPGATHTYIHSKTWIIDDRFAIIGSANCNRRGYTYDSEAIIGFADEGTGGAGGFQCAHRFRIALWAEHLNMDHPEGHAELADGVASAVHWLAPPPGAHVAPYDENRDIELIHRDFAWDIWDPDGS